MQLCKPVSNLENPKGVNAQPDSCTPSGVQLHGKFHGLAAETTHGVELPDRSLQISKRVAKDGNNCRKNLDENYFFWRCKKSKIYSHI